MPFENFDEYSILLVIFKHNMFWRSTQLKQILFSLAPPLSIVAFIGFSDFIQQKHFFVYEIFWTASMCTKF